MTERVPSPADAPSLTALELLAKIRKHGGKIYRASELVVFVITRNATLANYLLQLGGHPYLPRGADTSVSIEPRGGYRRAPDGPLEWDIYIHTIPVLGESTVWDAADLTPDVPEVDTVEFA